MKMFGIALLLVILLGGLLGTALVHDPGYVLVTYADKVLETSVWISLFFLALINGVLILAVYLLKRVFRGQQQLTGWRAARKHRAARQQTMRGLLIMAEDRWQDAQKLLLDAADHVEEPFINYVAAARAAHALSDWQSRDDHLAKALEVSSDTQFAVGLMRANFYIEEGQFGAAAEVLEGLRKQAPKHRAVLERLAQCYEATRDWEALGDVASDSKKYKVLSQSESDRVERVLWQAKLEGSTTDGPGQWKQLPRELRTDEALVLPWIKAMINSGRTDDAEFVIRHALELQWVDDLALLYGDLVSSDPAKQLSVAQHWLKNRPHDALANLIVGRLCLRSEKFNQAREAFEGSLRIEPSHQVYGELGRLCLAMGDEKRGAEYLLRSLEGYTAFPLPEKRMLRKSSPA